MVRTSVSHHRLRARDGRSRVFVYPASVPASRDRPARLAHGSPRLARRSRSRARPERRALDRVRHRSTVVYLGATERCARHERDAAVTLEWIGLSRSRASRRRRRRRPRPRRVASRRRAPRRASLARASRVRARSRRAVRSGPIRRRRRTPRRRVDAPRRRAWRRTPTPDGCA